MSKFFFQASPMLWVPLERAPQGVSESVNTLDICCGEKLFIWVLVFRFTKGKCENAKSAGRKIFSKPAGPQIIF